MTKRNIVRLFIAFATTLAAILGITAPAGADPGGTGHVYTCSTISLVRDTYQIPFKYIYKCSSGPMDDTSIQEISTYTFKQTGWISGECAWKRYHWYNVTNMVTVWNYCLTH